MFYLIIIIASRFLLLFQLNDIKSFRECMLDVFAIEPEKTIKPTYRNALIVLITITHNIDMSEEEAYHFYITTKDPQTKITSKYIKYGLYQTMTTNVDLFYKIQNHYPNVDCEMNKIIEIVKKNQFIKYFLFFCIVYTICKSPSELQIAIMVGSPVSNIEIGALTVEQTYKFYKLFCENLISRVMHPGIFILEKTNTENEKIQGTIKLSNTSTIKLFHPNHCMSNNIIGIGKNSQYGQLTRIPEKSLNPAIYDFFKNNSRCLGFDKNVLNVDTYQTFDGDTLNHLCSELEFKRIFYKWYNISFSPFFVNLNYIKCSHLYIQPTEMDEQLIAQYRNSIYSFYSLVTTNETLTPMEKLFYIKEYEFFQYLDKKTSIIGDIRSHLKSTDSIKLKPKLETQTRIDNLNIFNSHFDKHLSLNQNFFNAGWSEFHTPTPNVKPYRNLTFPNNKHKLLEIEYNTKKVKLPPFEDDP